MTKIIILIHILVPFAYIKLVITREKLTGALRNTVTNHLNVFIKLNLLLNSLKKVIKVKYKIKINDIN
jgi:hypothetical protein